MTRAVARPPVRPARSLSTSRGTAVLAAMLGWLVFAPAPAGAAPEPMALDSAHVMAQAHRGAAFVRPRAVALDTLHGEAIVANTGLGRIEFFDYRTWPHGWFTHLVPDPFGALVPGEPVSVAIDGRDRLFVTDLKAPYVDVLDYRGRSLDRIVLPAPDDTASGDRGPGALAVAPDGRLFVASRGAGRVHVFDAELRHVASWGVTGADSGQLKDITALALDAAGRVYVACAATTPAVQVFDADGRFAFGFGRHDIGPGNFSLPSGIAFAPGGRVCVSDAIRQVVQVFDSEGTFVGAVGGVGTKPGEFREPSALAGDGHGLLVLAEKSGGRFQVMWLR